jgi:hypothetical protein
MLTPAESGPSERRIPQLRRRLGTACRFGTARDALRDADGNDACRIAARGPMQRVDGVVHPLSPPNEKSPTRGPFLQRVGLCLSRLGAIQPSLAMRGTAPKGSASQNAVRFGRTSGFVHTPSPPNEKSPTRGLVPFGGEGGIRTHVSGLPDHLISSQRRYGHFGTSPSLEARRS